VQGLNNQNLVARPNVPFGFSIKVDNKYDYFADSLQQFFGNDYSELNKWLKNTANLRNELLYASPKGIPKVQSNNLGKFLERQTNRVNSLMLLYFLIAPYKEKQTFVQQVLHGFIKMIGKIPDETKLEELITNIDKAPIGYTVDLNSGKMKGIEIDRSIIEKITFLVSEEGLGVKSTFDSSSCEIEKNCRVSKNAISR